MTIKFRKSAIKLLQSADEQTQSSIRQKLSQLIDAIENQSIIPFNDLDIKRMKGKWEGFCRLLTGKLRVILKADLALKNIEVYTIVFRGDVYKNR